MSLQVIMFLFIPPPVSHVLVQCSCHHEGLDWQGAHKGLCFLWGEALQPGCLQGKMRQVQSLAEWRAILTFLHMQDKKTILSFTTGSQESMFRSNGINGDMNVTLWPLQVLHHEATNILSSSDVWLFIFSEWHPTLLWLPGSGPSDLLGSIFCFSRTAGHHAGKLARTAARPPGRRAPVVRSHWVLWQGEGLWAEAWDLWEKCHHRVWDWRGDPPGQEAASKQTDESWSLKSDAPVNELSTKLQLTIKLIMAQINVVG